MVGIQVIDDDIGVTFVTGSKDDDLEVLAKFFQAFHSIGPHIDSSFNFGVIRESDFKGHIMGFIQCFITMDKGFVQVED